MVKEDDELIVTSVNGMVIRMPVKGINILGRATMGVRLMKLREDDKVTAVARLLGAAEEERVVEAGRTITSCPTPNGDAVDDESEEPDEDEKDSEVDSEDEKE